MPESIRLPNSDKRRAWVDDAGQCNSFRARSTVAMSHGEACGHALHNGSASLAPFQPVAKANQTEMAVLQTAQVMDVAHVGLSKSKSIGKKEEERKNCQAV